MAPLYREFVLESLLEEGWGVSGEGGGRGSSGDGPAFEVPRGKIDELGMSLGPGKGGGGLMPHHVYRVMG